MNPKQRNTLIIVVVVVILLFAIMPRGKSEVYCINGPVQSYMPAEYWTPILAKLGAVKATYAQLEDAQRAGAEWCSAGFMSDGTCAWPRQTALAGCGEPPIAKWCAPAGVGSVTAYGVKPPKEKGTTSDYKIEAFNLKSGKWSMYDV